MRDLERYSTEDIGTLYFKGGRNMPDMVPTLEIERVVNLVGAFDWKLLKQEITEDQIVLTITKSKTSSLTETPLIPG